MGYLSWYDTYIKIGILTWKTLLSPHLMMTPVSNQSTVKFIPTCSDLQVAVPLRYFNRTISVRLERAGCLHSFSLDPFVLFLIS